MNRIKFKIAQETIDIEEYDIMDLEDIMECFKKNGYYYSDYCIKNKLHLSVNGRDLQHEYFPLSNLKSGTTVNVELNGNTSTIKYGNRNFIFFENEFVKTAINYICNIYKGCQSVEIKHGDRNLNENEELKSYVNYKLCVFFHFKFRCVSNGNLIEHNADFLFKVYEAKNIYLNH